MPQHRSCKKRLRQAEKANAMNRAARAEIRASLKVIRTATTKDAALAEMPKLFRLLDVAANKSRAGFNANRAANYKAKVAKLVNGFA